MSSAPSGTRLFVGNLHNTVTEGDLIRLFQKCGTVVDVNYMWHKSGPNRGQPKGFAFVGMSSSDEVEKAIQRFHGLELKGRKLVVSHSENEHMLTRGSRGSSYSLDRINAPTVSSMTNTVLAKRSTPQESQPSEKSGPDYASNSDTKKQRKELISIEERMRRIQQALKDVS